ncbi:MAG: hypothetical protein RBU21_07050 [FCB group bacterium]|jgi:hypothetical protein|nr:hypothetical protein [FCB group bacterium]
MNTKVSYLYRDACNYKTFHEVVLAGVIGEDDIKPLLKDETFFVPSEVGLPDLQQADFGVDDHIWHEIVSISKTDEEPSLSIRASDFLKRFRLASQANWNEYAVFKRKGLT